MSNFSKFLETARRDFEGYHSKDPTRLSQRTRKIRSSRSCQHCLPQKICSEANHSRSRRKDASASSSCSESSCLCLDRPHPPPHGSPPRGHRPGLRCCRVPRLRPSPSTRTLRFLSTDAPRCSRLLAASVSAMRVRSGRMVNSCASF
jgi:hypothetical protein